MNAPAAPLVRASYARGTWSLTVKCPLCDHLHHHGGGTDIRGARRFLGHRASHCPSLCEIHGEHRRRNGYYLTDPGDVIGRAERDHAELYGRAAS